MTLGAAGGVVVVAVVAGRVFAHLPITLKVFQTERRERGGHLQKVWTHKIVICT